MFRLEEVSKQYSETLALNQVTFDIRAGEVLGIVGKSGSGKSTLLKMMNFMELPTAGKVWFDGREVTSFSRKELRQEKQKIGMVFQHFNLLGNQTILQNVALPLKLIGRKEDQRVLELLDFVGLKEKASRYPRELSGGEKQRVAFARALVRQPKVLLCDESTSSLDEENTEDILRLLRKIQQELGLTVVFVSHELDTVKKVCDRVVVLEKGDLLGEVSNTPNLADEKQSSYFDMVKRRLAE